MNYPKKTPDMCGRFDVSSKKSSGLACLNLHKREVIENIFIKSVKDFSEKRNFISFKPKDPNILNIVCQAISNCYPRCPSKAFFVNIKGTWHHESIKNVKVSL